jgi:hypothetical protein
MNRTATGYRITFEKQESVLLTNLSRGFVHLLAGLWAPQTVFPITAEGVKRYTATRNLYELSHRYLDEAILCTKSKAYFASGIVGCAMVESILMLACVRDRDLVFQTLAWKAFCKKGQKARAAVFRAAALDRFRQFNTDWQGTGLVQPSKGSNPSVLCGIFCLNRCRRNDQGDSRAAVVAA